VSGAFIRSSGPLRRILSAWAATVFGVSVTIPAGSLKAESGTQVWTGPDLVVVTFTATDQRGQLELVGFNSWSKAKVYMIGMPGY
jgi:hypothetical protein